MSREETLVPGIYRQLEPDFGGSLVTEFWASYKDLVRLLGDPNSPGDGYKVSTEWALETEDGVAFRIYDYKKTNLYDSDMPSVKRFRAKRGYAWHLGGPNDGYGRPTPLWANKVIMSIQNAIAKIDKDK